MKLSLSKFIFNIASWINMFNLYSATLKYFCGLILIIVTIKFNFNLLLLLALNLFYHSSKYLNNNRILKKCDEFNSSLLLQQYKSKSG